MEGLDELLKLLADKLGVGLDFVQQNAPQYLEEYGRYALTKSALTLLVIGLFLSFLVAFIGYMVTMYIVDECSAENEAKYKKIGIRATISGSIIALLFLPICEIIIYLSSPQMYAIQELLNLLK